ncbi:MAG TPA: YjbQ family protein [Smithella sp.]|nr:YjbQ family protein [Smithella sp.]
MAAVGCAAPRSANYRHLEGNSAAHVKSSLVGASDMAIVENGARTSQNVGKNPASGLKRG